MLARTLAVALTATLLAGATAHAAGDPLAVCASSKRKAAGKKAASKLKCWAKAAKLHMAADPTCLMKAELKFSSSFAKADAKGGCFAPNDASTVEGIVDGCVNQIVGAEPDTATTTTTTTSTTTTTTVVKRVFVTSVMIYTGNLGGLAGADATCNSLASAAALSGTYKAWLSDSTASPNTRFVQNNGAYKTVDGAIIATSYASLVYSGSIASPLNIDETGATVGYDPVWTNTNYDGNPITNSVTNDCSDWGTASIANTGFTGVAGGTNSGWTYNTNQTCDLTARLYCFEQ